MTIWYIDPVSGNDANAGTSWGAAFKTFSAGPTAAHGVAAGDTIRCAKSPDDVSVGTATWTNHKIGNSVTFDSAISKTIDLCKSGWVALSSSTVVNGQSTAYMTPNVFGAVTGNALQVTCTSANSLAYKNLGSAQDFSGNTQVCFWYRSSTGLDLTGAQNMYINLCSGTGGSTVVNACAMPKWVYATNTWYPIVIDTGGALGASIQSVSITTTNAIASQVFYFDDMFAAPAGGVTLWSLLKDNNNAYYAIRTIRGADVCLMFGYQPSNATAGTQYATAFDTAWSGTTANFTTYKRETLKAYGTIGPTAATWATNLFNGVWTYSDKRPVNFSFGWNTSSNTQDGYTFIDNIVGLGTAFTSGFTGYTVNRLVGVRFSTGLAFANSSFEFDNIGVVANSNVGISTIGAFVATLGATYSKTYNILFITGNGAAPLQLTGTAGGTASLTFNIPVIWGNYGAVSINYFSKTTFNITNMSYNVGTTITDNSGYANIYNITRFENAFTSTNPTGVAQSPFAGLHSYSNINITDCYCNTYLVTGCATATFNIGTLSGAAQLLNVGTSYYNTTFNITTNNSTGSPLCVNPFLHDKVFLHNYGGVGNARVMVGNGSGSVNLSYFDLQTGDVYTSGSKAWKYYPYVSSLTYGLQHDLKLASAAAVAGKLVTITCYVKQNVTTTQQACGIEVPANQNGFLPGYSSDIYATFSGTPGSFQQLTITFTPTQDCVFDVNAWVTSNDIAVTGNVVWDTLSITQAA